MPVPHKTLQQTITIRASPHEVYEALLDSKKFTTLSGDHAKIDRGVGGTFSAFNGYVKGKNMELVTDQKIVWEWQADEEGWPKNHFSLITIVLTPASQGTRLDFTQDKLPQKCAEAIEKGWEEYYWEPLKQYVEHADHKAAEPKEEEDHGRKPLDTFRKSQGPKRKVRPTDQLKDSQHK